MNEQLNKFLEDNINLLEQELFLDAFLICPKNLRKDFIKTLKDGLIQITDKGLHYYGFRNTQGYVLIASKYNAKLDVYDVDTVRGASPENKMRLIITDSLATALELAAVNYLEPVMLQQSYIDSISLVPIKLQDGTEMLMSQDGVDYYNPTLQKERRFKLAAKEELDDRFDKYTRSIFNRDRLKSKLKDFNNNLIPLIFIYPAELVIVMDYNDSDKDLIKDILVKEINSPIEILWNDPISKDASISVELKSKLFDKIKAEVEDLFGVKL